MSKSPRIQIQIGASGVNAVRSAFSAINTAANNVKRSVDNVSKAADVMRARFRRAADAARSIGRVGAVAGGALTAAGGLLVAQGTAAANRADEQIKEARAVGLTVEEYGKLLFAAEQSGVRAEEFSRTLVRISDLAFEAARGNESAAEAFANLGISAVNESGDLKDLQSLIFEISGAFSSMPAGIEKTAAAVDLFGSRGSRLINFFDAGKDGLADLLSAAEETGDLFSTDQALGAEAFNDTVDRFLRTIRGIRNQIGISFIPALTEGAEALEDFTKANKDAIIETARLRWDFLVQSVRDFVSAFSGRDADIQLDWVRNVISAFRDVQKILAGSADDVENEFVLRISGSITAFRDSIVNFRDGVLSAISDARDIFNLLTLSDAELKNPAIAALADDYRDFVNTVEQSYNNVIKPAFDAFLNLLEFISDKINSVFGTDLTGNQLAVAAGFAKITGILGVLIASLGVVVAAFKPIVSLFIFFSKAAVLPLIKLVGVGLVGVFGAIPLAIGAAIAGAIALFITFKDDIFAVFAAIGDFISGVGASIADAFLNIKDAIFGAVTNAADFISEKFSEALDFVGGVITSLPGIISTAFSNVSETVSQTLTSMREFATRAASDIRDAVVSRFEAISQGISSAFSDAMDRVKRLWDGTRDFFSRAGSLLGLSSRNESATVSRSSGGRVVGPGSGTSDSILARISNGEYVIRAASVRKFGARFFDSLNAGLLPGFATGGLVGAIPIPAGPSGPGGRTVVINLDGTSATLSGSADSVSALEKRLRRTATAQTSRKPNWYK